MPTIQRFWRIIFWLSMTVGCMLLIAAVWSVDDPVIFKRLLSLAMLVPIGGVIVAVTLIDEDHFKNGDLVALKSGGKPMRVVDTTVMVLCAWRSADGNLREEPYEADALERVRWGD